MKHRIPDDPEMPNRRRPVTQRPRLGRRRRRQGPGERPELGD
jgi:hypothetical protein